MPVNFQPYIPQATDLLTPAMNMVRLKQSQEEMGLLRDYRGMQMQQMQMEQQKVKQQESQAHFKNWFDIYDKIGAAAAKAYARNNPTALAAFQGLDEDTLYSDDFLDDMFKTTKKVHKLKEISRDPQTIKEFMEGEHYRFMSQYGGRERHKEAITEFGKDIPSDEEVRKQQAQIILQSLQDMPKEDRSEWESKQEAALAGLSPELHKQWLEQKVGKEAEITGNVIQDKTSPTGYSYVDKQGKVIAKGAPMPSVYKLPEGKKITPQEALKRITELEKMKVTLQTTKGADPFMLFMAKDNPEMLDMLQKGDITGAIDQIDREIGFLEKHTGGSKKEVKPVEGTKAKNPTQIRTDFQKDPSMKGNTLSKEWVPYKGYKVYKNGKVVGYYY